MRAIKINTPPLLSGIPLLGLTLLAGCALPLYQPAERGPPEIPTTEESGNVDTVRSDERPGSDASGATVALLAASRTARADGDYVAAGAVIERALAIDSNNPQLWVELAEIRFAAGDRPQAEELARKALTLAGRDSSISARAARHGGR
jgi:tetratricopeptide (TPR) repeat protein